MKKGLVTLAPLVVCLVLLAILTPLRVVIGVRSPGPVGFGFGAVLLAVGSLPLAILVVRRMLTSRAAVPGGSAPGPYRSSGEGSERGPRSVHEIVGELVCVAVAIGAFGMLRTVLPLEKPSVQCITAPCEGASP
jgi:hypothetical protein